MTAKEILALAQAHRSEPSLANYTALADAAKAMEADAKRWYSLCDLVNDEKASVTFMGRVNTIHTGLEVFESGDLHDELDLAMKETA